MKEEFEGVPEEGVKEDEEEEVVVVITYKTARQCKFMAGRCSDG